MAGYFDDYFFAGTNDAKFRNCFIENFKATSKKKQVAFSAKSAACIIPAAYLAGDSAFCLWVRFVSRK